VRFPERHLGVVECAVRVEDAADARERSRRIGVER
jgi:hypothetical protein